MVEAIAWTAAAAILPIAALIGILNCPREDEERCQQCGNPIHSPAHVVACEPCECHTQWPVWCHIHQHYKWCEHNGGVLGPTGYEAPSQECSKEKT